jgi:hypothetical protein
MGNAGSFKKGQVPWNKGMKGLRVSPESEFKTGQYIGDKHPCWKGGVQVPKNDCTYLYAGVRSRVRKPRAIYEAAYGRIPKGYVIYHIDGDKRNDELMNLEAISRAELLKRNNEQT